MAVDHGGEDVAWEEVAEAAEHIFDVWVGKPELRWAEIAWKKLQEEGLTRFRCGLERHIVLCRLLVLGGIYRDFCHMAWGESAENPYGCMAEGLAFEEFVLGRLYERAADGEDKGDTEPFDALESIVEAERSAVVSALRKAFGGDNGLYESLWMSRSIPGEHAADEEGQMELIAPGLLEGTNPWSPVTAAREQAYNWVTNGCQRASC